MKLLIFSVNLLCIASLLAMDSFDTEKIVSSDPQYIQEIEAKECELHTLRFNEFNALAQKDILKIELQEKFKQYIQLTKECDLYTKLVKEKEIEINDLLESHGLE